MPEFFAAANGDHHMPKHKGQMMASALGEMAWLLA